MVWSWQNEAEGLPKLSWLFVSGPVSRLHYCYENLEAYPAVQKTPKCDYNGKFDSPFTLSLVEPLYSVNGYFVKHLCVCVYYLLVIKIITERRLISSVLIRDGQLWPVSHIQSFLPLGEKYSQHFIQCKSCFEFFFIHIKFFWGKVGYMCSQNFKANLCHKSWIVECGPPPYVGCRLLM